MTNVAYVFPGQGSQKVGMGQQLVQAFPVARDTFSQADEILGFSLSSLCFSGPADVLTQTENAQPALLVTSIAALRSLRHARPDVGDPGWVAGHSLGEYTALVAAGALDFADAVRLTRIRGQLMARAGEAHPGSMAAILKLDDEQVASICREAASRSNDTVQVANYNSPGQVVVSGGPQGVAAAADLAKAAGARVIPLAVSVASHSELMRDITGELAAEIAAVTFHQPSLPVVGNVNAVPLTTVEDIRQELVEQLTSPVRWTSSVRAMVAAGAKRFVEVGPGNVLAGLLRRIDPEVAVAAVAQPEDIAGL